MELNEIVDLNTATVYLLSKLSPEDIIHIKYSKINELDRLIAMFHHGFGTNVRNTLGLWKQDTPVVKWFSETYDLRHADDISSIIIENTFRQILEIPGDEWLQQKVDAYHQHWLASGLPRNGLPNENAPN
jgi:hypothetical protein